MNRYPVMRPVPADITEDPHGSLARFGISTEDGKRAVGLAKGQAPVDSRLTGVSDIWDSEGISASLRCRLNENGTIASLTLYMHRFPESEPSALSRPRRATLSPAAPELGTAG